MKFDNSTLRRQDRILSEEESKTLLRNGEYGYLSMISDDDKPYGIPISYVWDEEDCIYFHGAPEGHKLRAIARHKDVSFCVVGHTRIVSSNFTTKYQSIVLKGTIELVSDDVERMRALEMLLDKYAPDDKVMGLRHAEKTLHRTGILRLKIDEWSGKSNKEKG